MVVPIFSSQERRVVQELVTAADERISSTLYYFNDDSLVPQTQTSSDETLPKDCSYYEEDTIMLRKALKRTTNMEFFGTIDEVTAAAPTSPKKTDEEEDANSEESDPLDSVSLDWLFADEEEEKIPSEC